MYSGVVKKARFWKLALLLIAGVLAVRFAGNTSVVSGVGTSRNAAQSNSNKTGKTGQTGQTDKTDKTGAAETNTAEIFKQYCLACHSGAAPKAGINIAQLTAQESMGENFQQWEKVAEA